METERDGPLLGEFTFQREVEQAVSVLIGADPRGGDQAFEDAEARRQQLLTPAEVRDEREAVLGEFSLPAFKP